MTTQTLAEQLRALRDRKGWTQLDLAKRLNVSMSAIYDWENGGKIGPLDMREKVRALLEEEGA